MTVSIGAAMFPAHGRRAAELIRRADAAMYAAKKSGGNRWRFAGRRRVRRPRAGGGPVSS
jgi:diguanylate cyclase (GGDEF)-like protein